MRYRSTVPLLRIHLISFVIFQRMHRCLQPLTTQHPYCTLTAMVTPAPLLYYYSSPVRENLSSTFDKFLPGCSQFESDHRADFSTPSSCQSATFVLPFFCVCPLFFMAKNHKQRHRCDERVSLCVIDQLCNANDDPNALLQINR